MDEFIISKEKSSHDAPHEVDTDFCISTCIIL